MNSNSARGISSSGIRSTSLVIRKETQSSLTPTTLKNKTSLRAAPDSTESLYRKLESNFKITFRIFQIERCNYFLQNMVTAAKRGEEVDGRLVSWLLHDPTCDGGQWDMIVNLINRHGLVPKKLFPESYSCESTMRMNSLLKSKLREFGKELRDLISNGASDAELDNRIIEQMTVIYRIVGICLGIPSEKFTWEYYDKSKNYNCVESITPVEFYERYVKPCFNVDDKVCLVTDPRPTNPYGKAYTVDCLGNVVGGRATVYNNQPVELLMNLCAESIKQNEPVWFGCEVSKRFAAKQGIQDLNAHDFKLVFGTDVQVGMSKADRLLYGESMMTHAMAFTAVSVDVSLDKFFLPLDYSTLFSLSLFCISNRITGR